MTLAETQLRIARDQYAHVFLLLRRPRGRPYGWERILIPSPKVAAYDYNFG